VVIVGTFPLEPVQWLLVDTFPLDKVAIVGIFPLITIVYGNHGKHFFICRYYSILDCTYISTVYLLSLILKQAITGYLETLDFYIRGQQVE